MKIGKKIIIERPLKNKSIRRLMVGVTPFYNGIIIVNCAGGLEDLDGRNKRYEKMARFMQKNKIGTVIRIGNELLSNLPWPSSVVDDLKYIIDYSINHGEQLSGRRNPKIFLMGYSAGAGIVAAVGSEFSSVEKMLLIAPGIDCGRKKIQRGLEAYTQEVYIVIGENDLTVGHRAGKTFYNWAIQSRRRELREIPNCTHDFEGETNSKILSKAPLWAFAGDPTFPSEEGGIIMYDKSRGPFQRRVYYLNPKSGMLETTQN